MNLLINFKKLSLVIYASLLVPFEGVVAAEPVCQLSGSTPYCEYNGYVERIYINNSNIILIYFDNSMDVNAASNVGISGVSKTSATSFPLTSNPEFGELLYSTALSAQATNRKVKIQMKVSYNDCLKVDKIWLDRE